MSKKKILVWASMVVVGGGAGAVWWQSRARAKEEPPAPTAKVRKGDLRVKVSATGAVEPEYTVEVKSKASGVVEEVGVVDGDLVQKGALLVTIDPILERRRVTQAEAELRVAQAQAQSVAHKRDFAQAQLRRDEGLLKKGLVSSETVDAERKEVAVLASDARMAAANVVRAREQVQEARDRLAETKIRAPVTGTVLERLVQPGQVVASGTTTVNGGTTLMRIADLSRLFVRVKVDEADVAKLRPQNPVRITADALAGKVFAGRVLRVAPQGKVESNVTVFDVVVEVDAEGRKHLRPMMTANVEIVVEERRGVVLVPANAVQRRGPRSFVTVAGTPRAVEVGLADGKEIEVRSGLAADEEVTLPAGSATARAGAQRPGGMGGYQMRRMMGGGR